MAMTYAEAALMFDPAKRASRRWLRRVRREEYEREQRLCYEHTMALCGNTLDTIEKHYDALPQSLQRQIHDTLDSVVALLGPAAESVGATLPKPAPYDAEMPF